MNLGSKEVKEVNIKSVSFNYGFNALTIDGSEIDEYFSINKYVTFDRQLGSLKTKKVDGKHNPSIILKPKYITTLIKE